MSEVTELYDVILGCCTTNQRTSCITYIHNIYLQWYLQQDPKLFLHHPHDTDRCDLPSQSPKPESPLRIPSASPAASPSPLPPISGFQSSSPSLRRPSWFTVPVSIQQQCSSNRHKGICSCCSGGGSSKGNSSRSNISILAAIAATAWQPHGAYQTRPRSVHVQSISQIARVRSNFTRCHDRPLPFAVPSVTTVIVSSDGSSAIRAIWFMYNRPPGNM